MTHSKFSLSRYYHFTAKPGFFFAKVVGEPESSTATIGFEAKLWLAADNFHLTD